MEQNKPMQDKQEFYTELNQRAAALLTGQAHKIANAANLSALLFAELDDINWAGFYFVEDGELIVGPFQGQPACVKIPLGKGVCGVAAQRGEVQRVADVQAFPGHIACDAASRSEIVIPLQRNGRVIGVLDIDSPSLQRFDQADEVGLKRLAETYMESINSA